MRKAEGAEDAETFLVVCVRNFPRGEAVTYCCAALDMDRGPLDDEGKNQLVAKLVIAAANGRGWGSGWEICDQLGVTVLEAASLDEAREMYRAFTDGTPSAKEGPLSKSLEEVFGSALQGKVSFES